VVEHRLERITVRRIDMAIAASLIRRVTFNEVFDQVTSQSGIDAANVLPFDPGLDELSLSRTQGCRVSLIRGGSR